MRWAYLLAAAVALLLANTAQDFDPLALFVLMGFLLLAELAGISRAIRDQDGF